MVKLVKHHEWNIIEDGFNKDSVRLFESIMSLGNGHMGIRGNFEEDYSGDSLRGTYIAGVYYPDKTRVGWWKNGYPEYFAKVLNSINFIGIKVKLNHEVIDLNNADVSSFRRVLNMKEGWLLRSFIITGSDGSRAQFNVKRFLSMKNKELASISYSVTPLDKDTNIEFIPYLDADVYNQDSNYDEYFWRVLHVEADKEYGNITLKTKKLDFVVSASYSYDLFLDSEKISLEPGIIKKEKFSGNSVSKVCPKGSDFTMIKYAAISSNRYFKDKDLKNELDKILQRAKDKGFYTLLNESSLEWNKIWQDSDIEIKGDIASQQGIRFNIFNLNQTYTGDDPELNIGPKGFTGEKYGGSTYWDTEAYCLPFYLSTKEEKTARNLLLYRYKQLPKAIENAKKLGLSGALYPMVTMNGEECHNEWEITFEEIHRNAAISYAIYNYVRYTKDEKYLADFGFEVLAETSRFWASRVSFSQDKQKYVILGVTGPNEYENNVNNNWYTNYMAVWNIKYTLDTAKLLKEKFPKKYAALSEKLSLTEEEMKKWLHITENIYLPYDKAKGIFLQQDGYLDKEQILVSDIPKEELPINKHWSWDKILRSPFIKQADVLQGIYFFNDKFDTETMRRNFDYYEPRTVHESSLSSCIYSIIASEIGNFDKAYELYLRTSRLDLDNYNKDTDDGLHITSMTGSYLSIVHGFGGFRLKEDDLSFNPYVPDKWESYSFKFLFRGRLLNIMADKRNITISLLEGGSLKLYLYGKEYKLKNDQDLVVINKINQEVNNG
ncbi:MAG: glycoside hydrolase family 65 protein [Bacillota bacterium]|nr:glycoside hydrolase family 65 protein [Bacillota bacterium]